MQSIIKIHPQDNVAVALRDLVSGETIALDDGALTLRAAVQRGHKVALCSLAPQAMVIKSR